MRVLAPARITVVVVMIVSPVLGQSVRSVMTVDIAPLYITANDRQQPLVTFDAGQILRLLQSGDEWLLVEFDDARWGRRVGWVQQKLVVVLSALPNRPD